LRSNYAGDKWTGVLCRNGWWICLMRTQFRLIRDVRGAQHVPFGTEAEAQAAGYKKARNCP